MVAGLSWPRWILAEIFYFLGGWRFMQEECGLAWSKRWPTMTKNRVVKVWTRGWYRGREKAKRGKKRLGEKKANLISNGFRV